MENRDARRARRHLRRAQELLGFGGTISKLNFGQGFEDIDVKTMKNIYSFMNGETLKNLKMTSRNGLKGLEEYLQEQTKDPSALMKAVNNKDAHMVDLLLMHVAEVTDDLITFIAKMDPNVREKTNQGIKHVRRKLDEIIGKYDELEDRELIFDQSAFSEPGKYKPALTIDKEGIPKLIIVKIVMNEGDTGTIYATLVSSWKGFDNTFFMAHVIDGCEALQNRYVIFSNWLCRTKQEVMVSRMTKLPDNIRQQFKVKFMTLCTPLDLIKKAYPRYE